MAPMHSRWPLPDLIRGLPIIPFLLAISGNVRADPAARPVGDGDTEVGVLDAGLSFYCPFDGATDALIAKGISRVTAAAPSFVPGKAGQALISAGGPIETYHPGNLDASAGTVAFWTRPDWLERRDAPENRQFFRCKWINLNYSGSRHVLFFMTGNVQPPEGFRWDYSVSSTDIRHWTPGEWHHIAFSWNAATGHKALYIDGARVAEGTTSQLSDANGGNATVRLGISAGGAYDEWMIWTRELSPEAVALLANRPEAVAAHFRAVAAQNPTLSPAALCPLKFDIPVIQPPAAAIVEPGTAFTAEFGITNRAAVPFDAEVGFSLIDFRDRVRASVVRRVVLGSQQTDTLSLAFECPDETGVFKVAAHVPGTGSGWICDVSAFAAWPKPKGPPDPDSFFGNHVNSWFGGAYIRQAARLGLGWVRDHDMLQATWWGQVQPEPGPFKWLLEDQVQTYVRHRMPILGALTGTPWWAVAGGPKPRKRPGRGYSNPPDTELWRTYCRETLLHYKDRIRYWEVYNEPAVSIFWNGTPQQHAELVRIACEVAREVDPGLKVMASGYTYPNWRWHEENAKAGAWKDLDILSIHITAFDIPEKAAQHLALNLEHFRDLLETYGPGRDTPIWSTEGGMGDTTWFRGLEDQGLPPPHLRTPINARRGAIRVVQGSAIMLAQGIRRHFIYLHNLPRRGPKAYLNTCMIDINNAPRPKLMARVAMAAQLDGTQHAGDVHRLEDGRFWAHVFQKKDGNGSVLLWWVGDEGVADVLVDWPSPPVCGVDIMGNRRTVGPTARITGEPAYVHIDAPAEAVLAALRNARIQVRTAPVPLPADMTAQQRDQAPDVPALPDFVAPSENPAAVFTVDLRPYCNMGFADPVAGDGKGGWSDEGPMNDMRQFATGRQTFYGVPFDVIDPAGNSGRSVITLYGQAATPSLPPDVTVPLEETRRVRCLYFLHAAAWGTPGEIGEYRILYSDGASDTVRNAIPETNGNWWNGWHPDERARPVPVRVTNAGTGKAAWRYVRVLEWQNPNPGKAVSGIEAVSAGHRQTPILIAITGVGF
jgi:hypothetical protein